jgi:hypothetical protein
MDVASGLGAAQAATTCRWFTRSRANAPPSSGPKTAGEAKSVAPIRQGPVSQPLTGLLHGRCQRPRRRACGDDMSLVHAERSERAAEPVCGRGEIGRPDSSRACKPTTYGPFAWTLPAASAPRTRRRHVAGSRGAERTRRRAWRRARRNPVAPIRQGPVSQPLTGLLHGRCQRPRRRARGDDMSLVHAEQRERAAELWAENRRRGQISRIRAAHAATTCRWCTRSEANAPNGGIRPPGTNCGDVGEKW